MRARPRLDDRLETRVRVSAVTNKGSVLVRRFCRRARWLARGVYLFGVARMDRRTMLALSVVVVTHAALNPKIVVVPVVPHERYSALAPFLPSMWSVVVGLNTSNRLSALERGSRVLLRVSMLRAIWIVGISATIAALQAILMVVSGSWNERLALDGLFFSGLAILGACTLGARAAWFLPLLVGLALFFVGVDSLDQPRRWNVLLSPPDASGADLVCWGVWLLGVVVYVVGDSRPSPDRESIQT